MPSTRPAVRRALVAVGLSAVLLAALLGPAEAAPTIDGSSQERAAASCWEVKQNVPSSTSGTYWLRTPQLQAPTRFHCDMTTDGGGWVLVGRGRDGWTWDGAAQGTPDQVADTITTTKAFAPRKLSAEMIDGLLAGGRVDALADGVRLRRAENPTGSAWQESRFRLRSRDRWSWAFGAGHPVSSFTIDGASGSTSTTRDFGTNSAYRRVTTYEMSANNYLRGFVYGQSGFGTDSANSYVYSTAGSGRYGTPFTQVFIRPRTLTSDLSYPAVPDSGTAARVAPSVARSGAMPAPWGVTGTGAAGTGELATEVSAFAQVGNTMYVGGNFTTVRNADASQSVAQPYLAAFDATSGAWISSFRPRLNNQVKSLAALPDGRLAVGGDFTSVEGTSRAGLAVYDVSTGELDTAWAVRPENRSAGSTKVSVRALDASGGRLYVGGQFTHLVAGASAVFTRNAGRIVLSTRKADTAWNPDLNGTVTGIDVDDDGTRAYLSGYFTTSGTAAANRGAAISTEPGAAPIRWAVKHSTASTARYQQAVRQVGDKVWLGGSQHNMFSYDTTDFALQDSNITKSGGDIQAMDATTDGRTVYAGCHCGDWSYSGTTDYDGLSPGQTSVAWDQADKISLIGAWDNASGRFIDRFAPQWKSRGGYGVWAIEAAADGTLWTGGSMTSAVRDGGGNQWVGGFVRFAPRPSRAPDAPGGLSVALAGSDATVRWSASTTPGVTHEVLRDDRVVATTTGTSVTVPGSAAGDRFFVRASDGQGNRSASTSVVRAPEPTAQPVTVLEAGSSWSYLSDDSVTVPAGWQTGTEAGAPWRTGQAALGWGSGPIATNIDAPAGTTRPVTSYFRRTVQVADPGAFTRLVLTTRADDGVAVYVNGVEVARSGLPAGPLTRSTYATSAPSTAAATASPVVVDVPVSLLRPGANVIAAEVHSNYRSTPSLSFDASLEGRR